MSDRQALFKKASSSLLNVRLSNSSLTVGIPFFHLIQPTREMNMFLHQSSLTSPDMQGKNHNSRMNVAPKCDTVYQCSLEDCYIAGLTRPQAASLWFHLDATRPAVPSASVANLAKTCSVS